MSRPPARRQRPAFEGKFASYCRVAIGHPVHGPYHDDEYGVEIRDDNQLFERMCLEIFQAGLSWLVVLKKRESLRAAFDGFNVERVAGYDEAKIASLLADPGIIRHRGKILAIIANARRIEALRQSHGGFAAWLDQQPAASKAEWVKVFKKSFTFTGGEIVGEFLMSIGRLPGAHDPDCPVALRRTLG